MRCHVWAAVALVTLGVAGNSSAQSGGPSAEVIRSFAVQYADGRTTNRPLGRAGRVSWTSLFPRVPGAETSKDGLPLNALQFEEALDGRNLEVTVALLYGMPHQRRVKVATVSVTDDHPVRVDELEAYGVKPVVLSIVSLPPPRLLLPSVTTPSSQLDVTIEPIADGVPGYRMVVSNRSSLAVMMFAFESYHGDKRAISGSPHGPGHTPLIPPGEVYTVTLPVGAVGGRGASPAAWTGLDRVVITSVVWSDGLVEGGPRSAAVQQIVDAGTAQQLVRVIALLRAAAQAPPSHPLSALRADIAALPIDVTSEQAVDVRASLPDPTVLTAADARSMMALGMQNAKNAALNDVDELLLEPHADVVAYGHWLAATVAKFDAWRLRIVTPAR